MAALFHAYPLSGDSPLTVTVVNMTTKTSLAELLMWNFGMGTVVIQDQPEPVVYQVPGTYRITLTRTSPQGTVIDTVQETIQVFTPVVPEVSFEHYYLRANQSPVPVRFRDTSTNRPTRWLWDFGDGDTTTMQHPVHVFRTAGEYRVSLQCENGAGTSSKVYKALKVQLGLPVAAFTSEKQVQPKTIWFRDTSASSPTKWEWHFGDGSLDTERNPVKVFEHTGNYTVTLRVTNELGSHTGSQVVRVD